ncbi:unnamed protein product [Rangifer tarandus platyrhynchus]|uniref:Uncharacterized protein n=1 Tax=Rangifer tarandus platyrhynchus TaxID=3082113 RepID=A0AC59YNZ7_RANTA
MGSQHCPQGGAEGRGLLPSDIQLPDLQESGPDSPVPTSSNSAHVLHPSSSPESRTQLKQPLVHSLAYNDSVRPNEVNGDFSWTTAFSLPTHPNPVAILLPVNLVSQRDLGPQVRKGTPDFTPVMAGGAKSYHWING